MRRLFLSAKYFTVTLNLDKNINSKSPLLSKPISIYLKVRLLKYIKAKLYSSTLDNEEMFSFS